MSNSGAIPNLTVWHPGAGKGRLRALWKAWHHSFPARGPPNHTLKVSSLQPLLGSAFEDLRFNLKP